MSWSSPRTWVTGEVVTAALMNTHVRDNLNAINGNWGDVTMSEPVRAIDTIYQNTGDMIRLVAIALDMNATGDASVNVDDDTPPVDEIWDCANVEMEILVTFIVPPSYYYRANEDGANVTVEHWFEWDILAALS